MKTEAAASRSLVLARAIRDYWAAELPRRHPNYPLVNPDADSGPPPPQEKELRQFLKRLSADTVYKLALIMYLGQGDFDTTDLPAEYQAIKASFESPAALIAQMLEKAPLADYLEEGMAIPHVPRHRPGQAGPDHRRSLMCRRTPSRSTSGSSFKTPSTSTMPTRGCARECSGGGIKRRTTARRNLRGRIEAVP
jgi:hypothetical protein